MIIKVDNDLALCVGRAYNTEADVADEITRSIGKEVYIRASTVKWEHFDGRLKRKITFKATQYIEAYKESPCYYFSVCVSNVGKALIALTSHNRPGTLTITPR